MDSLQARIKSSRIDLGLSQAALAHKTGVSQPTVANWERGSHIPRSAVLERIGEALGVTPFWLMSGSEQGSEAPSLYYLQQPIRHIPVYPWSSPGSQIRSAPPTGYFPFATDKEHLFGLANVTDRPDDHEIWICNPAALESGKLAPYIISTPDGAIIQRIYNADDSIHGDVMGRLVAKVTVYN